MQDQAYLLSRPLRDWLLEDHLAWLVLEADSQLDLSAIEGAIQSKDALEAEAGPTRACTLREQAEAMDRTAHTHPDSVVRRRARTNAAKRRAKAEEFAPGDNYLRAVAAGARSCHASLPRPNPK